MGYFFLWLEQLVFCWLLMATVVAFGSAIRIRWLRWTTHIAAVLLPILIWAVVALTVTKLESGWLGHPVQLGLTLPLWLLVAGIAVGGGVVLRRGCWSAEEVPPATLWPVRRLALATSFVLAAHVLTLWNLDLAVRQQIATLRTEAGSLALANSPPRVVDRENAALLYQQAFEGGILANQPKKDWLDERGRPIAGLAENAEFLAYVRAKQPLLKLVREATERPGCHFGRDWGRPSIDMLLPEIQNMRTLARALVYEAHYRAQHDDLRGAFDNVVAVHHLAEHAGQEPILISLLVSFALDGLAKSCLEHLLQAHTLQPDDLAAFDKWQPIPNSPRLQRALRLEEAFGLATFAQLAEEPQFAEKLGTGLPPVMGSGYRIFLLSSDISSYRRLMERWQKAALSSYAERHAAAERITNALRTEPTGPLTFLLLPALQAVHTAAARADAQQRLSQLALAMHRHRLAHGAFPKTLDELVAQQETFVPIDPFSDKPLRLIGNDDSWVLYSIGPDLVDDGGTVKDGRQLGDLIFEWKAK